MILEIQNDAAHSRRLVRFLRTLPTLGGVQGGRTGRESQAFLLGLFLGASTSPPLQGRRSALVRTLGIASIANAREEEND